MIGGLVTCSLIDYPGELAAVVFTKGCNLRCRYCHNPELCSMEKTGPISFDTLRVFLSSRQRRLTAVVVTGGEPTLHQDLPILLRMARSFGFLVKVDTNGMLPKKVRDLIFMGLMDYAAVDLKVSPGASSLWLTGAEAQGESALLTLSCIVDGGVPCEARTTVIDGLHDAVGLEHMAHCLASVGIKKWRLQPVEGTRVLDTSISFAPPDPVMLLQVIEKAKTLGIDAAIRPYPQSIRNTPGKTAALSHQPDNRVEIP
jgi:pyruvate formate lyase activating enzyme